MMIRLKVHELASWEIPCHCTRNLNHPTTFASLKELLSPRPAVCSTCGFASLMPNWAGEVIIDRLVLDDADVNTGDSHVVDLAAKPNKRRKKGGRRK